MKVMSLPTITNLTATSLGRHHSALAVIIILKHATSLRFNLSSTSALTQAELDYREANIDSKIQQHLAASSSQEQAVELFASFIMATDVVHVSSDTSTRA